MGRAARWRTEPPRNFSPGDDVYLVIRGTIGEEYESAGENGLLDRIAVVSYGSVPKKLAVAVSEPGVNLLPAAAAHALAVCLP